MTNLPITGEFNVTATFGQKGKYWSSTHKGIDLTCSNRTIYAITRNDISIWQYGKNCHPIYDDNNNKTTFNIDLVKNDRIIINHMF